MDRWSVPPTRFQRWIAKHRAPLMVCLVTLLLVDLVLGVLELATGSGHAAVGTIGSAAGLLGAFVSFRGVAKFVVAWDAKHSPPKTKPSVAARLQQAEVSGTGDRQRPL